MFSLNGKTLTITQGDTGNLAIDTTGETFGASDRAQLTVTDKKQTVLLQKVAEISNGAAAFEFANADTADIPAGAYQWELRFVKNATITNGKITAGDEINTPFDGPMPMRIIEALGDIGATGGN